MIKQSFFAQEMMPSFRKEEEDSSDRFSRRRRRHTSFSPPSFLLPVAASAQERLRSRRRRGRKVSVPILISLTTAIVLLNVVQLFSLVSSSVEAAAAAMTDAVKTMPNQGAYSQGKIMAIYRRINIVYLCRIMNVISQTYNFVSKQKIAKNFLCVES